MDFSVFVMSIRRLYQDGKIDKSKVDYLFETGKISKKEKQHILDRNKPA